MKRVTSLIAATVVATFATVATAQAIDTSTAAPAARPGNTQVVATYFHGDVRCVTCKKLEAYSRAAVEKAFASEIASGRVVFRLVNTDRPENEHFLKDYALVTKALVVTEEADGKVLRWTNLDKIWTLVRGDQQAYTDYVVAGVRAYLGPAS